jgi:2-oxoisovalerate dehydrogenase E1 component
MLEVDHPREHSELGLTDEQVVDMYRKMLLARRLDDRMWSLNRQGRVPFVVSASGHEGVQTGAAFALDPTVDWFLPYYRDTALVLALGITAADVMLGLFSRAADPSSGGRQMPNHWSEPDLNIFTHSSVIAAQFPHACGIAHQLQAQGSKGVVLVSSGEGATSEGDWHEAMNFAGIQGLPVIFLVQNNNYAISVPVREEVAGSLARRAEGYRIKGVEVDGNDALAVYSVVTAAADRARAGDGPTLIEAHTYRYYAHTFDDDDKTYRSAAEVEQWRRKDPVTLHQQYLVECRLLDHPAELVIDAEVNGLVTEAVERATAAPNGDDPQARVYANPIAPKLPVVDVASSPDGEIVNMVTAINRTMHELMADDGSVCTFGEDVADPKGGVFKASVGLSTEFGADRCFNTPLAESPIVGIGVGMAAAGGRPIAEIQFADFIHPAFDQIVLEAARIHYRSNGRWTCPMVIRAPYGGGVHGALYHSQSIEAFYAHVPGLKVVVPSTPADAKGLLRSAIEDPDPVMILEPKKLYRLATGPFPEGDFRVPLGQAALRRIGSDLVIIAYGTMSHYAAEAADRLTGDGIDVSVLDLRSLKPLDWPSIEAAIQRTGKALIVHEDNEFVGFGAEVAAQIGAKAFDWLDAPVQRYAAPDVPTFPFAASLEDKLMPNVEGIVQRARDLAAQ